MSHALAIQDGTIRDVDPDHVTTGFHARGIQVPRIAGGRGRRRIARARAWHAHTNRIDRRLDIQRVAPEVRIARDEIAGKRRAGRGPAAVARTAGDLDRRFRPQRARSLSSICRSCSYLLFVTLTGFPSLREASMRSFDFDKRFLTALGDPSAKIKRRPAKLARPALTRG